MLSGNTVLMFKGEVGSFTKETQWVIAAFGTNVEIRRREFAVVAKGLPAARLRSIHDSKALLEELKRNIASISRCRIYLLKLQY